MKKKLPLICSLIAAVAFLASIAWAQVQATLVPTPAQFTDSTLTNSFTIGSGSGTPFVFQRGTTTYTGVSTNFDATNDFTLTFVNGVLVSVEDN